MIAMTHNQALELIERLERQAKNLEAKADFAHERALIEGQPPEVRDYFEKESLVYTARAIQLTETRKEVCIFLQAYTYSAKG